MAAAKKEKKKKGKAEDAPEESAEGTGEGAPAEGGEEADAGPKKKKLSGKTLVLFIALPAVVLIAGGVGAAFFLGLFGGGTKTAEGEGADGHEQAAAVHTVFFDMPELLVNLSSGSGSDKTDHFLKLALSLELPNAESTKSVEEAMPRVIDAAQVFLRELRLDDLEGSAGMQRLREELLRRVDAAVAPVDVHDVLFKEIIIQ